MNKLNELWRYRTKETRTDRQIFFYYLICTLHTCPAGHLVNFPNLISDYFISLVMSVGCFQIVKCTIHFIAVATEP